MLTYIESSKRYLDLCIESIKNLNYQKEKLEVILVARNSYKPEYEGVKTVTPLSNDFYPAEGYNFGVSNTNPASRYLFMLNDDVMLTKNSLTNLVTRCRESNDQFMINPISPCDNEISYGLIFGYTKNGEFKQLHERQYRYEDLETDFKEMMAADSIYPPGIVKQPFLCMYATIIPRSIYEKVGPWDEQFKTGQDDLDYSLRAQQHGIGSISALDALVWHFGGVSAESTLNLEIRRENVRYFKSKWGIMPPGIPESFIQD